MSQDLYADYALIRTIDLQRVATWLLVQITGQLDALQGDILAALLTVDPTGVAAPGHQANRLDKLLYQVRAKIEAVFTEITNRLEEDFQELLDLEEQDQRDHMLLYLGAEFDRAIMDATTMLILGATLGHWLNQFANGLQFRFGQAMRSGVQNGEDLAKLIERVKGTKNAGFNDGVLATTKTELEKVLRTGADKVPNEASTGIAEKNTTVIRYGWQQISVLDARTTKICTDYAWKIWNMHFEPVGHKLPYEGGPPRHPNCRSRVVLILLDDPLKPTPFSAWVGNKTQAEAAAIFGAKKMELWRAGKISDTDLIRQRDRQLSLDDYRAKVEGDQ